MEFTAVKAQVAPVGSPFVQEKVAFPGKLLIGVTVMVIGLALPPAEMLAEVGVGVRLKSTTDAVQATASLFTSTEPNPVTRLYPVVASESVPLKPNTPVLVGHWIDTGIPVGVPGEQ